MKPMDTPKVGDTIWFFDQNRRKYRKDPITGHSVGSPIWRKYWVELKIIGETKVSWIIGYPSWRPEDRGCQKVKKAELAAHTDYCLSAAVLDERAWIEGNRHAIVEKVRLVKDIDVLRQIAALVGHAGVEHTDTITLAGTGF